MNIALTEFWINRPMIDNAKNFTILSDRYTTLNSVVTGYNKVFIYTGILDKYQLKAIVIDDTFYVDFSATGIKELIDQQIWILKHTKSVEYKVKFVCLWELFKLPTIEELNNFARNQEKYIAIENYNISLTALTLSTDLPVEEILNGMDTGRAEYISSIQDFNHLLSNDEVHRHATVVYNHHYGTQE
jgi:hypothetical protein